MVFLVLPPKSIPQTITPVIALSILHRRGKLELVSKRGFTLIEILVAFVIVSILAISVLLVVQNTLNKGKDAARKTDITQMGRILSACYLPENGGGQYDIVPLLDEIFRVKPQYKAYVRRIPKDPRVGTETQSGYIYIVSADGTKCAVFANLENQNEPITLKNLTDPAPGGGSGVLRGNSIGVNGTNIYFQVSN